MWRRSRHSKLHALVEVRMLIAGMEVSVVLIFEMSDPEHSGLPRIPPQVRKSGACRLYIVLSLSLLLPRRAIVPFSTQLTHRIPYRCPSWATWLEISTSSRRWPSWAVHCSVSTLPPCLRCMCFPIYPAIALSDNHQEAFTDILY